MTQTIQQAAVLGAGIMGTGIAAHLANCGIKTYLLDIVPPALTEQDKQNGYTENSPEFRNRLSTTAVEKALKGKKPIPSFYHDDFADLIQCGNLEDHLHWISDCDWVVEAVVENLGIKQALFTDIEKHLSPDTIVSSNTSGLPIEELIQGRTSQFQKRFLVTHFFNPVRIMRLIELVPSDRTDPQIISRMEKFASEVLGKGVVFGFDTPNFIGNRIGVYTLMRAMQEMVKKGFTIEEVDAVMGEPLARPKSAVFRTIDLVGLDTAVNIMNHCHASLLKDESRDIFIPPGFIAKMVKDNLLGNKTQSGFYKKTKDEKGDPQILVMDYLSGSYRPKEKVRIDSIKIAKNTDDPTSRIRNFVQAEDRAGEFAWEVMADTLIYAGMRLGEIAGDIVQIDNAMKWGYNWTMGPFESWDAIGFVETCKRMQAAGKTLPTIAQSILDAGAESFYQTIAGRKHYFDAATGRYQPIPADPKRIDLAGRKNNQKEIAGNLSATLVDSGDGVLVCEFHSKMNTIDADTLQMMQHGLDLLDRDDTYIGMVIGNQGENFCAGANVMLLLANAQQGNWDEVEKGVKLFQDTNLRLKFSKKPVVAAPFGIAIGGGAEISMSADRICAHADLFMGQVEFGVGLIPAGGGTKEVLVRHLECIPEKAHNPNLTPFLRAAFELIGMAKVSMSAHEAASLRFLRSTDKIITNRDHLLHTAKNMVMAMHLEGYTPPRPRKLSLPGKSGYDTFRIMIDPMWKLHQITEHEKLMAEKLAWVLCGGNTCMRIPVTEQAILDLEREAFLSLLGTEKTKERIIHFLTKGKPLRN